MLAIDDMKKLARMQEVLLERTIDNRETNLEKYKSIVINIDEYTFDNLFSEMKQYDNHNQTLEDELQFLEQIKESYQQLLEQQLGFKRRYDLYGNGELQLSDLSQIDIEYIEDRINTISGYLINKKNIETNENKLQELNEKLIVEEKNKDLLSKRLLEFEEILRDSFINAEGRIIVGGKLQYISVISEYNNLGIDFKQLLNDNDSLEELLSFVNSDKIETGEKLRTAEICYNNAPSVDSKQILDDIKNEDIKVKYKLTMLKIIDLLSKRYDNYDLFREKREQLLDLIKYRLGCIEKLGLSISIDPFSRTKVSEQYDIALSLKDNSRDISRVKKEIASLDQRLEEMFSQNNTYMIKLGDKKDLIISKMSINDIDISDVDLGMEFVEDDVERIISDNQVVSVRDVSEQLNGDIVRKKTSCVIRRVNEMVNGVVINEDKVEVYQPELVIVPQSVNDLEIDDGVVVEEKNDDNLSEETDSFDIDLFNDWSSSFSSNDDDKEENDKLEESENVSEEVFESEIHEEDTVDTDIFMTVDPFLAAPLFNDRADEEDSYDDVISADDNLVSDDDLIEEDNKVKLNENDDSLQKDHLEDEMPDAFWVTQGEETQDIDDNNDSIVPSFDEQIDALLSDDRGSKTKKLSL